MTETYHGIGWATSQIAEFMGGAALLVAAIAGFIALWTPPGASRTRAKWAASILVLYGAWALLCSLLALPNSLYYIGFTSAIFAFLLMPGSAVRRNPESMRAFKILAPLAVLFSASVKFTEENQKITLSPNAVAVSQPTNFSFRHRFVESASRTGLHIELTTSPSFFIDSRNTWMGWRIWTDGNPKNEFEIFGNRWYWGPHGPITGIELGKRFVAWSGVSPTVIAD